MPTNVTTTAAVVNGPSKNDSTGAIGSPGSTLPLNRDDTETFRAALDPAATEFTFQTFDDNAERADKQLTRILHGTLGRCWDLLTDLNRRGAGVFVTVNETDGRGRTAENIKRVRALFIDLDGTPLPAEDAFHVKPHIIIESSPGRWHCYWLVTNCTLDQFNALQRRLIRNYDSDKSVHDLPRVMRLPGFVHQKVDKHGRASVPSVTRVAEAHDHEPYTVEQVAEGLPAVEHAEAEPAAPASGKSDGQHAGEAKLRSALAAIPTDEQVLTDKLGDSHEVFVNIGRAIERLDWGEHGFAILRDWCRRNPAKFDEAGLRTQWDSWHRTRGHCKKPVTVKTIYHYARQFGWKWGKKAAAASAIQPSAALEDFYAYLPQHNYMYMPTRELWPGSSVDTKVGEGAAEWLDQNRAVVQMTWAPGMPTVIPNKLVHADGWIDKPGDAVFNLYLPPALPIGDKGKAAPWLDLVRKVYPHDADHLVRYFAHRVQRPHEKINHGLVLGGPPGIGKDTIFEPVRRAVGPWNVHEVSPQQVLGRFNSFVKSVILRVSEARDLGELNRFALYEHMKTYLAAPPNVLRCDEKNIKEHSVFNVMGVVITSNRKDSFYLPEDDRRHYVAWSELTKEGFTDEYWKGIWRWYDHEDGCSHVAAYLMTLDLSAFNPKAPPPKTTAFWEIVEANRAPENSELADAIDELGNPDAVTLDMVKGKAHYKLVEWLEDRRNGRQFHHRMGECGYVLVRNSTRADGYWKFKDKRLAIYAKSELSIHDRHLAATALVEWRTARFDYGDPK